MIGVVFGCDSESTFLLWYRTNPIVWHLTNLLFVFKIKSHLFSSISKMHEINQHMARMQSDSSINRSIHHSLDTFCTLHCIRNESKTKRKETKEKHTKATKLKLYHTSARCSGVVAKRIARWKHGKTKSNWPPYKQHSARLQKSSQLWAPIERIRLLCPIKYNHIFESISFTYNYLLDEVATTNKQHEKSAHR